MNNLINLNGQCFGSYTVIGKSVKLGKNSAYWDVKCVCGTLNTITSRVLRLGKATQCKKCRALSKITHNESKSRLYSIWRNMKTRCNSKKSNNYKYYGGRGITMCQEWSESFESFRDWALANGYTSLLECDRIDNDGNYAPNNCRWVTHEQNSYNTRGKSKVGLPKGIETTPCGGYSYAIRHAGTRYKKEGFSTVEAALLELIPLREQLHGEFAHN